MINHIDLNVIAMRTVEISLDESGSRNALWVKLKQWYFICMRRNRSVNSRDHQTHQRQKNHTRSGLHKNKACIRKMVLYFEDDLHESNNTL